MEAHHLRPAPTNSWTAAEPPAGLAHH